MAQDRITLPSGGAGLTRFSDVTSSKIEFSPGGVIVLTLIVMLIIVILHSFGKGWFGL
ncbi:preprotein translocase subunit Sec61beta [Candidatus Woesearchaeota archaeon]|nr:preprotein translocase subunit Sec61beta [Candidatus Woesearchaeota archaeon]